MTQYAVMCAAKDVLLPLRSKDGEKIYGFLWSWMTGYILHLELYCLHSPGCIPIYDQE